MSPKNRTGSGFRGYFQSHVPEEDKELTHVGPGTPCGEYIRRAWQPVALASDLDDTPHAVRVLGEDLVVFRDGDGRIGVLHRHCSHRGASLEFGIIMPQGISCCYHGWHYDIDGTLLDTPGEPAGSRVKERVVHGAYPALEHNGIVFAYMGPPDEQPEFPIYDTMLEPDTQAVPFVLTTPCNWLQVYENTQDPVHVVYLHTRMSGVQFGAASGAEQVIDYKETPLGMINIQTRRWGEHIWNRTTDSILPNANQTGAIWEEAESEKTFRRVSMTRWMVPIDNTTTVTMGWRYFNSLIDPRGQGDASAVGKERIDFVGQTADERSYKERQRQPGDYEAQVSQRPIAIHALENRASSDRGVAMLRKLIRQGIRAVASGEPLATPFANPIPTFSQDTVMAYPQSDEETALLARFGESVAEAIIEGAEQRDARAEHIQRVCARDFPRAKL